MYSLYKVRSDYKVVKRTRKSKGWIISSCNSKQLTEVANNLVSNLPKLYLKRIDTSNTSLSSIESREDVQPNLNVSIVDDDAESQMHEAVNARDNNNSAKNVSLEASELSIHESNLAQQSIELNNFETIIAPVMLTPVNVNIADERDNINVTNEILNILHTQETPSQQDFNINFSFSEIFGSSFKDIVEANDENDIFNLSKGRDENISFGISHIQQNVQLPSDVQPIEQIPYTQQFNQQISDVKQIIQGITLISIQVYNRRRAGEIEKVLVEDYKHYKYVGKHTDPKTYNSLTEAGKQVDLLIPMTSVLIYHH